MELHVGTLLRKAPKTRRDNSNSLALWRFTFSLLFIPNEFQGQKPILSVASATIAFGTRHSSHG